MASNNPSSFHTQSARNHALSILHFTESLITTSLARNESTAATRTHYLRILYNLPAGLPEHHSAAAAIGTVNSPRKIAKAKGRGKARAVERVSLGADGAVPGGAGERGKGRRGMREAGWGDVLPEKFRVAAAVPVKRDDGGSGVRAGVSGRNGGSFESKRKGKGKENVYIKREEEEDKDAGVEAKAPESAFSDDVPTTTRTGKQRVGAADEPLAMEAEEQDQEDGGVSLGSFLGRGSAHGDLIRGPRSSPGSSDKRRRQRG